MRHSRVLIIPAFKESDQIFALGFVLAFQQAIFDGILNII